MNLCFCEIFSFLLSVWVTLYKRMTSRCLVVILFFVYVTLYLEISKSMEGEGNYNSEINEENCPCEENELKNEDTKFPDYSYRKRANFFYAKISSNRCKKHQCLFCNFETNYRQSLQRHFIRHSNTRPHKCQNCEYTARVKYAIKIHLLQGCGKAKFTAG